MTRQSILLLSLGMNLGLLTLVALLVSVHPKENETTGARFTTSDRPPRPSGNPAASAPTPPSTDGYSFQWEWLESSDYSEYIERLRVIGCPGETIADIIRADVESLCLDALDAIDQPESPTE